MSIYLEQLSNPVKPGLIGVQLSFCEDQCELKSSDQWRMQATATEKVQMPTAAHAFHRSSLLPGRGGDECGDGGGGGDD